MWINWYSTETLWQLSLLIAAILFGYHAILGNARTGIKYLNIGFHVVNFAFWILAVSSAGLLLVKILSPSSTNRILAAGSLVSWFVLAIACTRYLALAKIGRLLVVSVLVLIPVLSISYVAQRPQLVEKYSAFLEERNLTCTATAGSPAIVVECAATFFFDIEDLRCNEDEPSCLAFHEARNELGQLTIFGIRVLFWFVNLFVVLRYYGQAFEVRQQLARHKKAEYDLKGGVVAQSASVLSTAIASFFALLFAGVDFAQLGLFGGLIGAGVSVALRDTLGNFAAGIVLLWDGTIRKGDVVTIERTENPETGGTYGIVEDVRLRYTLIRDRDTVHRLIPNSLLIANIVENWTHDQRGHERSVRIKVSIPVPYGANLKSVREILESSCYEVARILRRPAPKALVAGFGDSAINFSLRFFIRDPENGIRSVISDIYYFIAERLGDIGVSIPFPQLDVHLKDLPNSRLPLHFEREGESITAREMN